MAKKFNVTQKMTIEIYKKKKRKLFCKIEIDDYQIFEDIISRLNSPSRFVKLTENLVVDKTDIDYIILN